MLKGRSFWLLPPVKEVALVLACQCPIKVHAVHLQMLASEDGHVIDAFQLYKPLAWKPDPAEQAAVMRTFVPQPPDSWLDRVGISFGALDQVRAGQTAVLQSCNVCRGVHHAKVRHAVVLWASALS